MARGDTGDAPAGAKATSVDATTDSQLLHAQLQVAAGKETKQTATGHDGMPTSCRVAVPTPQSPYRYLLENSEYSQADRCRSAHAGAKILVDDGCRRRENRTSWEYAVGPECPRHCNSAATIRRTPEVAANAWTVGVLD